MYHCGCCSAGLFVVGLDHAVLSLTSFSQSAAYECCYQQQAAVDKLTAMRESGADVPYDTDVLERTLFSPQVLTCIAYYHITHTNSQRRIAWIISALHLCNHVSTAERRKRICQLQPIVLIAVLQVTGL
jgi:hypothetical protein